VSHGRIETGTTRLLCFKAYILKIVKGGKGGVVRVPAMEKLGGQLKRGELVYGGLSEGGRVWGKKKKKQKRILREMLNP